MIAYWIKDDIHGLDIYSMHFHKIECLTATGFGIHAGVGLFAVVSDKVLTVCQTYLTELAFTSLRQSDAHWLALEFGGSGKGGSGGHRVCTIKLPCCRTTLLTLEDETTKLLSRYTCGVLDTVRICDLDE